MACSSGQLPTAALPCELGATASSSTSGDLTAGVLACPPSYCIPQGCSGELSKSCAVMSGLHISQAAQSCSVEVSFSSIFVPRRGLVKQLSSSSHGCFAGYQFAAVGVQNCAINSSSPVNSQFTVSFVVYDLNVPSQSATVNRTIVIIPVCPVGQVQCVDGTCNTVPICALRSAEVVLLSLLEHVSPKAICSSLMYLPPHCASETEFKVLSPPIIKSTRQPSQVTRLSEEACCPTCRAALAGGTPGLALSTSGNNTSSVSTDYGTASVVPLLPCTQSSGLNSTCGAAATTTSGSDISQTISAVDVTPCPSGVTCPGCDIGFAQAGLCPPGTYLFLYRARDSQGQAEASALRIVQVQNTYSATVVSRNCHWVLFQHLRAHQHLAACHSEAAKSQTSSQTSFMLHLTIYICPGCCRYWDLPVKH